MTCFFAFSTETAFLTFTHVRPVVPKWVQLISRLKLQFSFFLLPKSVSGLSNGCNKEFIRVYPGSFFLRSEEVKNPAATSKHRRESQERMKSVRDSAYGESPSYCDSA